MALQKFRDISEVPQAGFDRQCDAERLLARIAHVLSLARRLAPGLPRGVRRFRSVEEAHQDRLRWVRERARRKRGEA